MSIPMRRGLTAILLIMAIGVGCRRFDARRPAVPPPNRPAVWNWNGHNLTMIYNGNTILSAEVSNADSATAFDRLVSEEHGKVEQVLSLTSRNGELVLQGRILASEQAFPCEADRREDALRVVRHSVGIGANLLDRAVYDRKSDWVLSVDFPSGVQIIPSGLSEDSRSFAMKVVGHHIIIRFRPLYYQKHRGLSRYEPWKGPVWAEPVSGWCSWFAFWDRITEQDVKRTADVLAETLVPFGLTYMQIDDGYQRKPVGTPDTWLVANEKFPSGLDSLGSYIRSRGLKPGIWTNVSFHQKEWAFSHSGLFVRDEHGLPAYGNWIGYIMDGSNAATLDTLVRPVYRNLRKMGWEYFKVDALRHLKYEGYNSHSEHFLARKTDRVHAYVSLVRAIRDEIGRDRFILGCWGPRPELVGIIDGCRVGDDGFGYGGLAQYNSFNNVVWKNDPDHIELSGSDAYMSCTATSLTGSLFMLTDKPDVYSLPIAEAARRSLPVPFTLPGQIYDVDPSRSMELDRVDSETSGAGPRIMDADQAMSCRLFLLDVHKPFESWSVLGRIGEGDRKVRFSDLGLKADEAYLVFEFWSKRLLGTFQNVLSPGPVDSSFGCQVLVIREKLPRPQIVCTNRHITGGAVDLENVAWKDGCLSGTSRIVGKDLYILYVTEPDGFRLQNAECDGAAVIDLQKEGTLRRISLKGGQKSEIDWRLRYRQQGFGKDKNKHGEEP